MPCLRGLDRKTPGGDPGTRPGRILSQSLLKMMMGEGGKQKQKRISVEPALRGDHLLQRPPVGSALVSLAPLSPGVLGGSPATIILNNPSFRKLTNCDEEFCFFIPSGDLVELLFFAWIYQIKIMTIYDNLIAS